MRRKQKFQQGMAGFVFAMSCIFVAAANAEQAQTINAFSVWQASGKLVKTGTDVGVFVGVLAGIVYVETKEGPVSAGKILCPATLEVNSKDRSQAGEGRCTITGKDGAAVFAKWQCSGYHLVGCSGNFQFTGGTKRFKGITGGGPFGVRSEIRETASMSEGVVQESASGIMFWRNLRYEIP